MSSLVFSSSAGMFFFNSASEGPRVCVCVGGGGGGSEGSVHLLASKMHAHRHCKTFINTLCGVMRTESGIFCFCSENLPNILAFVERMKTRFWPDWEERCRGDKYVEDSYKLYSPKHGNSNSP